MAKAVVRSKAVVLLFLIHCILLLPVFMWALCLDIGVLFTTLCASNVAFSLIEKG